MYNKRSESERTNGVNKHRMETIVIDKIIFTIFGTLILLLLAAIGYFMRQTYADMRTMIQDHEDRIQDVEKHKERVEERHSNNSLVVEEIKQKLDLIYEISFRKR